MMVTFADGPTFEDVCRTLRGRAWRFETCDAAKVGREAAFSLPVGDYGLHAHVVAIPRGTLHRLALDITGPVHPAAGYYRKARERIAEVLADVSAGWGEAFRQAVGNLRQDTENPGPRLRSIGRATTVGGWQIEVIVFARIFATGLSPYETIRAQRPDGQDEAARREAQAARP